MDNNNQFKIKNAMDCRLRGNDGSGVSFTFAGKTVERWVTAFAAMTAVVWLLHSRKSSYGKNFHVSPERVSIKDDTHKRRLRYGND